MKGLSRIAEEATVIRDGKKLRIPAEEVVPGDILILQQGVAVPADARVLRAKDLSADESILTGESSPVPKAARQLRDNIVFRGSFILSGTGRAVVVATGMNTRAGKIQAFLGMAPHSTPLQRKLDLLTEQLIGFSLSSTAALFLLGAITGLPWGRLLKTSISMAVATIPEGLPTVSTWTFSKAVTRLLQKGILVRDLKAVEALGSIQTLCLDKTGTLTENRMKVTRLAVLDWEGAPQRPRNRARLRPLLECAALCNDAGDGRGSPTEVALIQVTRDLGVQLMDGQRLGTQYRNRKRRYMTVTHRFSSGEITRFAKGDPEQILQLCRSYRKENQEAPLDKSTADGIRQQNRRMSEATLRVLGFARKETGRPWTWLGMMGLSDPPRRGLKKTLARFQQAGIRTIMITGDQPATAAAIAREIGLSSGRPVTLDLEKEKPEPAALAKLSRKVDVFARVTPENKKEVIEAIRASGQVVGMVGDGINDAPALRAADVGIAIGRSGTEVAREVAEVVLLEDDLATLLEGVALGRNSGESLRKSIRYLVSTNVSEVAVVMAETALGLKEVMDPLQLLWINLVNDTVPALALAMDRPRRSILRKPGKMGRPLLGRRELAAVGMEATVFSGLVLGSLLYGHLRGFNSRQNQSMAVNAFAISQGLHAISCHSRSPIRLRKFFKRHGRVATASLATLSAHLALLLVPAARRAFKIEPIGKTDLAVASLLSLAGFGLVEAGKTKNAPRASGRGLAA
jgi:P-type Ca2+ transporter type 2C